MKKNKQLNKTFLFLLGFCFALSVGAQQKTVTGTVTGASDGMALPGVNVIIKGTSNGASTDFDGNYSIEVNGSDAILVFTYVGYVTKEITVASSSTVDVTMNEDVSALDEVVVVGYGARKKSDITGAVSSVKADELTAFPVLDATQALQGRAAGVYVQSNNGGEPGAPINIKVRGNTSIGANSGPLIVVDGFVGATMPQADDIQSMEVLKDASATAIYGSRGSGGVILVTTKKGRSGALTVEVNTTYSVQTTSNRLDLLDATQFADYQNSFSNYTQGTENVDWQDEIYQTGGISNTQASFSGGTDKINFYASGNYFKQEGIIVNSDFEKLTFLSNIDAQVTDKLKLGMNLFGSRGTKNGVATQSAGENVLGSVNGGNDDVVSLAFRFTPDRYIYDDQGNFTQNSVGDGIENPWAVANEVKNQTKSDRFRANTYLAWDIIEGLNFKTTLGYSTRNDTDGFFKPQSFQLSTGGASMASLKRTNILSENYLTYNTEFGKGQFTALAGYSYQKQTSERFSASTQSLLSDDFLWYNLEAGHVETRRVTSSWSESEIQSLFGRVNYDYNDKYLLTATVRRDGASNFAENNKYATFPSGAIGWKISNEDFLKDSETISNLKLRLSYGLTGNQAIGPYQSLAELGVTPATEVATDPTVSVAQEANPDLKWETSYQTNIGADLGMLNGAISLSLDYYNIDTKDLLLEATTTPAYSGATDLEVYQNVGEINNSGFEINLNTRNITTDNFRWTTDFNFSKNKNKVVKLVNGADIIDSAAPGYMVAPNTYILREGEEVGLFWGHEYRGVYQGGDVPAGTALKGSFSEAGDPLFTDVPDEDGVADGTIDSNDQKIIGNPNPDFSWGFTNTFIYKDFDFNIFFQGTSGGDILNLTNVQLFNGDSNAHVDVLNAWTPANTGSNIPSNKVRDREISSRFVEKGSYARLKNLSVGYSFPSQINDKLGITNLRLAISAQNLFTITNYSGLDPEVSYFGSGGGDTQSGNVVQGHDFGNYPTVQSFSFSLNLKF